MNCFSACSIRACRFALLLTLLPLGACGVSDSADRDNEREYSVHFTISPDPATSTVRVELRLRQPRGLLRELSFPVDEKFSDIQGAGQLSTDSGVVRWMPPPAGGSLAWRVSVINERGEDGYDAYLGREWGVFRLEDAIPRARTRTLRGAASVTTMRFDLPAGWSAISEYSAVDLPIAVDRAGRRYDEPAGWVAVGQIGVRRETIAGTRVAIAGPERQGVRRMDMLALLNWTLPELNALLPDGLPRLTVISAGEPMWRGGLSAPASLFLHADRPLISENATSALLHEVMHVALGIQARSGFDWIVEGLAEYYSIELLRRGRAITPDRARTALQWQADWGQRTTELCGRASTAATTARAVTILAALDLELRDKSDSRLDDVLPLIAGTTVDLDMLAGIAEQLLGSPPDALHIDALPGCRKIQ
jgi:hypothetical protein